MATYLDKLENKDTDPSSARRAVSYGEKILKIGPVYLRYSTKCACFLAVSYLTFTNKLCQLWSYWTKFHGIFTQYGGIMYAVNVHIEIVISHSVYECQSDKYRGR